MSDTSVSPLRGALLGLVARGPRSGYDLAKAFSGTVGNVWGTSHSVIYPELVAMEQVGLIAVAEIGKRGRKPYVLTSEGERALQHWLAATPRRPTPRSEALLRMFFLGLLEPDEARQFVQQELEYHRAKLAAYEEDLASGALDTPPWWTGGLMLELGIRNERMLIGWHEWVLEELDTAPARFGPEQSKRNQRAAPSSAGRKPKGRPSPTSAGSRRRAR